LLETDAFALVVAMVLDQQIPLERAFAAPLALKERLGGELDAAQVAAMAPDDLRAAFSEKPALHRFPAAMADRVQSVARIVVERYEGDTSRLWSTASDGKELLARIKALPGFGVQKAQIFVALLAKQLGIAPPGWEAAAGQFGVSGSFVSVADIDGPAALAKVREHKQMLKAAAKSLAVAEAALAAERD
jgi:uncharacterized HhH-GPD family protein